MTTRCAWNGIAILVAAVLAGPAAAQEKSPPEPLVLTPEPVALPVTSRIDLLQLLRDGRMEYHVNPTADIVDEPRKIFSFDADGLLRVSGRGYGGIATLDAYRDYRLVIEFKWGERTWGQREKASRDSGILVHCWGPQGALGGNWMAGIEAQIIEGGVGDLLVLSPRLANGTTLACAVTAEAGDDSNQQPIWVAGGPRRTLTTGRLNWQHRAADWKDVKGFRGKDDVESPYGEWTRFEVVADGDTLRYFVNGVKVNEAFECMPRQGRIQLQTEAAEMLVRRYELLSLDSTRGK